MRALFPILPLLLLACAEQADQAAAAVETNAVASEPAKSSPPPPGTGATAEIGPISISWDRSLLTRVDTEISVPPDFDRNVQGFKLVAADRAPLIGKAECMYGQSGQASTCSASKEAGLAFAMVETPFEDLRDRIDQPEPKPVSLAGREGIVWEIGAEGEGAAFTLLPADGGTLMIVRQHRTEGNPDAAAVEATLQSLSFED